MLELFAILLKTISACRVSEDRELLLKIDSLFRGAKRRDVARDVPQFLRLGKLREFNLADSKAIMPRAKDCSRSDETKRASLLAESSCEEMGRMVVRVIGTAYPFIE